MSTLTVHLVRERYFWCATLLVAFIVVRSTAGNWTGDFWSHGAAVRELSERPFDPRHAEIAVSTPSVFNTPYTVVVAWLARLGRVDAITALAIAGVGNLLLLLVGLRLYIRELFTASGLVAFYALIFILFLWGPSPWFWSGFFHFEALAYTAPYPSTFAAGALFLLLVHHLRWLQCARGGHLWILFGGSAIVLLTHPVTAMVLAIGILAQTLVVRSPRSWIQRSCACLVCGLAAVALATLWPYYQFWQALAARDEYHAAHTDMYLDAWSRVWPSVILGVPALAVRLQRDLRDPLAVMLVALLTLYVLGDATGVLTFGRLISYAVVMLQLCAAGQAANIEANMKAGRRGVLTYASAILIVVVLFAAVAINSDRVRHTLMDRSDWTAMYTFLPEYVGRDDVVLSDPINSYPVPTFAGKVVSSIGTLLLVPDAEARTQHVDHFFSTDASPDDRLEIIRRYRVQWVLLARDHPEQAAIQRWLEGYGSVVYTDETWVLIHMTVS